MARKRIGRPLKYEPEIIAIIVDDLEEYIDTNEDPTIVGFAANYKKYPLHNDYIYDRPEFSRLVKRAIDKQESFLLKGATKNDLNATFSIFRLKQPQHGYTDKQQIDQKVEGDVKFINNVPRKKSDG